ncbi:galanin receptor 2b-like [Tubulanus polymorphus]|uniref:galanin receptor 2b-like n=1 Tax=Tubulanus polymorphus TaxID=672921 RepID=UPI003DA200B8
MSTTNSSGFDYYNYMDLCFFDYFPMDFLLRLRWFYRHSRLYFWLPLGVISNMLAVAGSFERARRSSAHLFMFVLAWADITVLMNRTIFHDILQVRLRYQFSQIGCKIEGFVDRLAFPLSSWLLVLMTVDRTVAITRPLSAHRLCTAKRAFIQIITLVSALLIFNLSSTVWLYKATKHIFWINCIPKSESKVLVDAYEAIVRSLESYLPFLLITVLNGIMATSVRRAMKIQAEMTGAKKTNQAGNRVTVMVVIVSVSFLLLMGPFSLSYILFTVGFDSSNDAINYYLSHCDGPGPIFTVLKHIAESMVDLNYVINGYIYVATSSQFRSDIARVFCSGGIVKLKESIGGSSKSNDGNL